jgi:hypothetical protein
MDSVIQEDPWYLIDVDIEDPDLWGDEDYKEDEYSE